MTNRCRVDGCGRPTELFACWRCTEWLGDDLGEVPDLVAELDITATRQYRLGDLGPARSAEHPLPYHPDASDALWCLANVTGTWAVHVALDRGYATFNTATWSLRTGQGVARVAVLAAKWLTERLSLVRMCPEVGDAVDELRDAVRTARRAVNREPALVYAGTCPSCSTDERPAHLYAAANERGEAIRDVVACRLCGEQWSYMATRDAMRADVLDQLGTAAEIARALPALYGVTVNVTRVRKWASRGRIEVREHSPTGRPRYRIGDVFELLQRASLTASDNACHAGVQVDQEWPAYQIPLDNLAP